ncbi:hypothetical protein QNI19_25960 [Cytophagaceae bacterium DM2B3-1]|uniref:OmpA-like domain-containing protein n=1 Tax=Xanthocytophaga flava TaxID=3048013 RepID=A0ABT7CRN3_9BACT|nr:hypothetical protein [Xanthocytophaga flavus]MDJ1468629.1 hypothetical protein [Xanthocytophaga flavus]MDJ1496409.1 hypothetical protein [Xanthocytophaga flavus]
MFKFLVGFVVFALWSVWARSIYICEIRHMCQQEIFVDSSLGTTASLRISRLGEIISGEGQFMYSLASNYVPFTATNRFFLQKVSKYIRPNSYLRLTIEGRYTHSEKNVPAGMYENLGLARAALIRDSLVQYYQIKAKQIIITSALVEDTDLEASTAPEEPVRFLLSRDTKEDVVRYEFMNMSFAESNFKNHGNVFTPRLPFIIYTDSLKGYLKAYPNSSVFISTYVTKENGGQKKAQSRAQAVRTYLMRTKGVAAPIVIETAVINTKKTDSQSLTVRISEVR